MAKKNPVLRDFAPMLTDRFGPDLGRQLLAEAETQFAALCADHAGETKAVRQHTQGMIYPCIALYRAMLRSGIPGEEAVAFLDTGYSRRAEKQAASIRALMKLPGLYRLMPRMYAFVATQQFGTKAGFAAHFYPTDSTRVKFDMTRCLYCEVCRENGCPELVPCFCHTDDVTSGNMHPRLRWNRTRTMGEGADVCDFDLFITDKPE